MTDRAQRIREELEKMKSALEVLRNSPDETCKRQAVELEIQIMAVQKQLTLLEKEGN